MFIYDMLNEIDDNNTSVTPTAYEVLNCARD